MPAHSAFELMLIASLVTMWSQPQVRQWLLIALASHAAMRVWSLLDFVPKALAFERAEAVTEEEARRWVNRSRWRLLLDLVTCGAMLAAFAAVARIPPG